MEKLKTRYDYQMEGSWLKIRGRTNGVGPGRSGTVEETRERRIRPPIRGENVNFSDRKLGVRPAQ